MQRFSKSAWLALGAALLLPLISMMIIPLYDTSEPRYAEIARIMAESGDWITPWFSPGVPFWGKPPLSFWAQALSMKTFGFTEFAARFPSWLCLLLSNYVFLTGLRPVQGERVALWTAIVYSTCSLVYISSGAVLTDPFLALGTTLSLVSFARAVHDRNPTLVQTDDEHGASISKQKKGPARRWQYGFFLGLVIGILAKGPLAVVLSLAPVIVWCIANRKTAALAEVLPWKQGFALVAILSLPWYILAEIKTHGFLDYFIVGEHVRRFLDPGWKGDMYGTAHRQAYGTIWLYWLQATFPWGVLMLAATVGGLRSSRLRAAMRGVADDPLCSYWMASALFTPLFFTLSANILWTYLLPSLAGFSVLTATFFEQVCAESGFSRRRLLSVAGLVPAAVLVFGTLMWINPDLRNTERSLVRYVMQRGESAVPLVYMSEPPFSAQFYSAGRVEELKQDDLPRAVESGKPFYLAIPKEKKKIVADLLGEQLDELYSNKRYILVRVSGIRRPPLPQLADRRP